VKIVNQILSGIDSLETASKQELNRIKMLLQISRAMAAKSDEEIAFIKQNEADISDLSDISSGKSEKANFFLMLKVFAEMVQTKLFIKSNEFILNMKKVKTVVKQNLNKNLCLDNIDNLDNVRKVSKTEDQNAFILEVEN